MILPTEECVVLWNSTCSVSYCPLKSVCRVWINGGLQLREECKSAYSASRSKQVKVFSSPLLEKTLTADVYLSLCWLPCSMNWQPYTLVNGIKVLRISKILYMAPKKTMKILFNNPYSSSTYHTRNFNVQFRFIHLPNLIDHLPRRGLA